MKLIHDPHFWYKVCGSSILLAYMPLVIARATGNPNSMLVIVAIAIPMTGLFTSLLAITVLTFKHGREEFHGD